ncbi:MAG: hypothetical protein JW828_12070 [Sedimentisphaerales bacterium]|nr:hypothetical protein [Sedimentisphaerales bacterium]
MRKIICVWCCLFVGTVAGCSLRPGAWAGGWERIEYIGQESGMQIAPVPIEPIETAPDKESTVPIQESAESIESSEQAIHEQIEAAQKQESLWSRRQIFLDLASRPGLSDACQQHLVNSILDNLLSESAKEEVLLLLIRNPDFSKGAQKLILQRLNNFSTPSRRQRIASAMSH